MNPKLCVAMKIYCVAKTVKNFHFKLYVEKVVGVSRNFQFWSSVSKNCGTHVRFSFPESQAPQK